MKGTFNLLDHTGDTTLEWSSDVAEQVGDVKDLDYANTEFDRLVREGHLAFNTDAEGTSEQIKKFDPNTHGRVTFSPQFVGG